MNRLNGTKNLTTGLWSAPVTWLSWLRFLVITCIMLVSHLSFAAISNFVVTSDSNNIFLSYTFTGTPRFLQVYVDTDQNSATGYTMYGLGSNHLIENSILFKYNASAGTTWNWGNSGSSNMSKGTSTVRWTISRASLGSPSGLRLQARTSNGDSSPTLTVALTSAPSTTTTTTVPPSTVTWTRCATEGGSCAFTGTRKVRYGANGIYAYKTATGSIACNNATFGDPVVGVQKTCDYSSVVQSAPVTTTTVVTQPPTTTTVPTPPPTTTLPPPTGSMSQVSYTASAALIPNPERGFYQQPWCNASTLTLSQLQSYRNNDSITLVRCMWYLTNYRTGPLPQSALDFFQQQMNTLRTGGAKVILRFAYTDSESGDDAPHSVVMGHINQLAPYLQRNIDVIAGLEAGFIGAWGEWAYSKNYGFFYNWTAQNWADRKALVDRLLQVLPQDRAVMLRYPDFKTRMYGTAALSEAEAFTGTTKARLGQYNDCFVSNNSDAGTYLNKAVEYPWLAQETKYLPMGGETCSIGFPSTRSDCATSLQELEMFHWSYLNLGYYSGVLEKWKTQGCFNTIKAKLGYRFVLLNGQFSTSAKVGGSINIAINLENQGFASPYNRRGLELVLRNNSTGANFRVPLNADPRRWLPKQVIAINQVVALPANLPAGSYSLFLNLPDPAAAISARPEYSIQLSNANVWEPSTGYNRLNATVVVSP